MKPSRAFVHDLGLTLTTRALCFVLGFATNLIVARTLGSAGMGEFSLIMTTLSFLALCGSLGLDTANVYVAGKEPSQLGLLLSHSCWVALVGGVVLGGASGFLHPWALRTILQHVHWSYLLLGLCALPLLLLRDFVQGLLRGRHRLIAWNGTILANAVLLVLVLWGVLRWLRLGVGGAIAAHVLVTGLITGVAILPLRPLAAMTWRIDWSLLKTSIAYGLQVQTSNLLNFFNYYLSLYLLNIFLSTREVGRYSVAVGLVRPLTIMSTTLQYVLLPKVSAAPPAAAEQWMPPLVRQTAWGMGGLFTALWCVSRPLVLRCYGSDYAASIGPLHWLIPGWFFLSIAAVLSAYNCGRGRPDIDMYATLAALGVTIGVSLWLIPTYGMIGAAIASTMAFAILCAVQFAGYLRLSGATIGASLLVRWSDMRDTAAALKHWCATWRVP